MLLASFIFILNSAFGFLFLMSELRKIESNFYCSREFGKTFQVFYIAVIWIAMIFMKPATVAVFIIPWSVILTFYGVLKFNEMRMSELVFTDLSMFFDHAIISLKSGHSYRRILREYSFARSKLFEKNFRNLRNSVFFTQHFETKSLDQNMKFYFLEMESLSKDSFRLLDRLIFLRNRFKTENYLRHKSREKLVIVRFQVAVLCFMYFVLLFYNFLSGELPANFKLFVVSGLLFGLGILSVFLISRVSSCRFSDKYF